MGADETMMLLFTGIAMMLTIACLCGTALTAVKWWLKHERGDWALQALVDRKELTKTKDVAMANARQVLMLAERIDELHGDTLALKRALTLAAGRKR